MTRGLPAATSGYAATGKSHGAFLGSWDEVSEGDRWIRVKYPGVHSFRAGRAACKTAYAMAGLGDPREDLDFVELHDAYTSSEIQTVEDMGLCKYGEGGPYSAGGSTFMPDIDYGLHLPSAPQVPANPSGGLLACGHPVGASGLMQGVFALWQLQGSIAKHLGDATLQVYARGSRGREIDPAAGSGIGGVLPRRGGIHSHAGTGAYVTVTILERP